MNDRAAPERGDDRARNKRGPEGSQRTESPPRREGAVSRAKPQNEGPKKSEGRHRSKAKLDADAQGTALAFGGDEAQGPPDTSRTVEVPGREENGADAFPLGGRSPTSRGVVGSGRGADGGRTRWGARNHRGARAVPNFYGVQDYSLIFS